MTKSKLKTIEVDLPASMLKRVGKIAKLMECSEDEVITGCLGSYLEVQASGKSKPGSFISKVQKKYQSRK